MLGKFVHVGLKLEWRLAFFVFSLGILCGCQHDENRTQVTVGNKAAANSEKTNLKVKADSHPVLWLDEKANPELRARAIWSLPSATAREHIDQLSRLALEKNSPLQGASVWALGFASGPKAAAVLEKVVSDETLSVHLRADALIARANAMVHDVAFAEKWQTNGPAILQRTAKFVLGHSRGAENKSMPTTTTEWQKTIPPGGDVAFGRRLFFSPQLACSKCHAAEGRVGPAGPEFNRNSPYLTREKMIEAMVDPSREIAPRFQGFEVETRDGQTFTGLNAKVDLADKITLQALDGTLIEIKGNEGESFRELKHSLMPEGLGDGLSVEDFRDLLAYLESLR